MNAILTFIFRLLILLLSYAFIGWIGLTIYRDFRGDRRNKGTQAVEHISLTALVDHAQLEKHFSKTELILGRDPTCDFTLDEHTISLRHCKLTYHHSQWWAEDLGSTNGSFLNGVLIDQAVILTNGDLLRIGNIEISIQIH